MREFPSNGFVIGGRYQTMKLIASTGWHRVYQAHDLGTGACVVVKAVRPQPLEEMEHITLRLQREAVALLHLAHPRIVRLLDAGTSAEGYFLALEHLGELSLQRVLERARRLPPEVACRIMAQVLEGLVAAHARGLVHRDVKPANVMLTTSGVKLIDFGLADLPRTEYQQRYTSGTIPYIAPESVKGIGSWDPRSDVYACGLTLYEMLIGRHALGIKIADCLATAERDAEAQTMLHHHLYSDPVPFTKAAPELGLPGTLEEIVFKAIEKDPDDRFRSAAEMYGALLAAMP